MPTCNPLVGEKGLSSYAHIDAQGKLKRLSYDTFGVSIGSDGILNHCLCSNKKQGSHENLEWTCLRTLGRFSDDWTF